jgi:hypothetical protein
MAEYGRRQKGNVTRRQLLAAGFSEDVVDRRLRSGSLHPTFPGVHLVGHIAEPRYARECAAILYCAPRAMLSHRSSATLWGLPAPAIQEVEVTVVGRQRRSRAGLIVYSINAIEPVELRRHEGLPVASPSLTLLDLAGVLGRDDLARCLNEARVQELVTDRTLDATLAAHPNRRGHRALAGLAREEIAEFAVESEAEASTRPSGSSSRSTGTASIGPVSGSCGIVAAAPTCLRADTRSFRSPGTT